MNENYNENYSTDYNADYNANYNTDYSMNYNMNQYTTQQLPPKKKGKLGTVIALVAAVAIIGGASGFGGAYLAGLRTAPKAPASGGPVSVDHSAPSSGVGSDNGGSDDKQVNISPEAASAINTIYNTSSDPSGSGTDKSSDPVVPTGPKGQYTTDELYEAVNDTIVQINIYKTASNSYTSYYDYYFGYGDRNKQQDNEPVFAGYGSGIVFTEDGYILTNAHVVSDAERLEVVVNDYSDSSKTYSYDGEVIGIDNHTDIAIVKVERKEKFKAAVIGDSDTLKVGQEVCAIGNPGVSGTIMFPHTMTKGIVSGLNRVSLSTGYNTSSIQTDAAVNGGNSGGALFDMYGNVVGIVNKKVIVDNIENMGFAITINEAKPIMEDLIAYGKVMRRPVLGITTQELDEYYAQMFRTKLSKGLLVTSINENAAASRSGLRLNDIITKINGTNVETVSDVQGIIKNMKAGDKIIATVAREKEDGTVESVDIEIELSSSSVNN